MVWFVDIKLSVWDANGKMVRFGITGGFFVLLIMAAIAEVAIGIFFRDQVPTLFSIEEFYYGEGNVPTR